MQDVGLDNETAHLLSRDAVLGSAVGDGVKKERSASREKVDSRSKMKLERDIGCITTPSEIEKVDDSMVFRPESVLWMALAQETVKGSVKGSGHCDGENIFCSLNMSQKNIQEVLTRHNQAWTLGMKGWLNKDPSHWKRLIADVPQRPVFSTGGGRARAPQALTASPADSMKGLIAKYTWQYGRPCPSNFPLIEGWTKAAKKDPPDERLNLFLESQDYMKS